MLDVVERGDAEGAAMRRVEMPADILRLACAVSRRMDRALARSRRNVPKRHRHGRTQRTRGQGWSG